MSLIWEWNKNSAYKDGARIGIKKSEIGKLGQIVRCVTICETSTQVQANYEFRADSAFDTLEKSE